MGQLEIEQIKKRMLVQTMFRRQNILHKVPYIRYKARILDSIVGEPDTRLQRLFNTFTSPLLRQFDAKSDSELVSLNVVNLEGEDGNHGFNEHLSDLNKYRKMWKIICDRIVPSKTESFIAAMEEKAKQFGWRHSDNVCALMRIKSLNDENLYLLPHGCKNDFDLKDERMYHWEMQLDDDSDGLNEFMEQDVVLCEREKQLMQALSCQKNNTLQERLMNAMTNGTDVEYKFIQKNADKQLKAVSIPRIGKDGLLQMQIFHPMVQTMDHVEYEPTPLTQSEASKSVFDQFHVPIEYEIIHNSPIMEKKRIILPKKKTQSTNKYAPPQSKKRKFEKSVSVKDVISSFPPAKRQKLNANAQSNAIST